MPLTILNPSDDLEYTMGPLSFLSAIHAFWRVRKWRIAGSITMSYATIAVPTVTTTMILNNLVEMVPQTDGLMNYPSFLGREGDLQNAVQRGSSIEPSWNNSLGGSGTGTVTINDFSTIGRFAADPYGLIFYPALAVGIGFGSQQSEFAGPSTATVGCQTGDGTYDDGGTIEFPAYLEGVPQPLSGVTRKWFHDGFAQNVTASTLKLTVGEYWPYSDRSGNAIYDTTTGEQLRDPAE